MNVESSSPDGSLRPRTLAVLAQILETDVAAICATDRLRDDLGLDSLQSLELLSVLAEELRIDLPMEEAMELGTVEDACRFVEDAWRAQHAGAERRA